MSTSRRSGPPRTLADEPRRWLILSGRPDSLETHAPAIRDLVSARHRVRLGFAAGPLPAGMPKGRHRLLTQRRVAGLPTGMLTRVLTAPLPRRHRLTLAARHDRWLAHVAGEADHVVFLDDDAQEHLAGAVSRLAPAAQVWAPGHATAALREEAAWRTLATGARALDQMPPGTKRPLSRVLDPARTLLFPDGPEAPSSPSRLFPPADVLPELRRIVRWSVRRGLFDRAEVLLALTDEIRHRLGAPHPEAPALEALKAHTDLVAARPLAEPVPTLVRSVLQQADAALEQDDLAEAAELASVGIALLFHQQLHTTVPSTPLVTDTDTFLEPLRSSRVGALLAQPVPAAEQQHTDLAAETRDHRARQDGTLSVTVLPGLYDNHAVPLLEALDEDPRVDLSVVRLKQGAFGGLMVDTPILQYRLDRATGRAPSVDLGVDPELERLVRSADVVVADWADKGCTWASTVVGPGTRMVVRVHSVDVLSAPAHLVDWSNVDDVVFVSDHIKDLFVAVLGPRVAHVRLHVVTNIVPLEKFADPTLPDAARTLGMVGWAQEVKDPVFALEVLRRLVASDDRWRLRLMGSDFGDHHAASAQEYAAEFRRRALDADLVDRIDFTGFTRDLPRHLQHVGFILSTSLRESCPVGALEGTAAGAYPVIRDWPAFAPLDGARRLFPSECVVETPDEAAERILRLAEPQEREQAVHRIHELMRDQFSDTHTRGRLLSIILDPAHPMSHDAKETS